MEIDKVIDLISIVLTGQILSAVVALAALVGSSLAVAVWYGVRALIRMVKGTIREWGWGGEKKPCTNREYLEQHYMTLDSIRDLRKMDPVEFEKVTGLLFKRMGYAVQETKISGDHGIDLKIEKAGKRGIVQCKRYDGNNLISESVVRDFYGVMIGERAVEGYIVTTSDFSMPARVWANGKLIHLVNGRELADWIRAIREK